MIINKSQGQSLKKIGIYLENEIFIHCQFYVALSRVTTPEGLYILIHNKNQKYPNHIRNIVDKEILHNII